MAKTIKFNLICDGYPARTIEDLLNHFSVEDLLDYFDNGLLVKWLDVRGYNEELQDIRMIRDRDPLIIIEKLIKIFHIEEDETEIKNAILALKLQRKRKETVSSYTKEKFDVSNILEEYHKKYTCIISELVAAKDDTSIIKSHIQELADDYYDIFKLIYRDLFYTLHDNHRWLALMYLLAIEKTRDFYIPTTEELLHSTSSHKYKDKKDMFNLICKTIRSDEFETEMGTHLKKASTFSGYWKNIEPSGRNYMIIRMQTSEHVRSAGKTNEDLEYYDISNKFIVLNGIDYKSTNANDIIYYMEV